MIAHRVTSTNGAAVDMRRGAKAVQAMHPRRSKAGHISAVHCVEKKK